MVQANPQILQVLYVIRPPFCGQFGHCNSLCLTLISSDTLPFAAYASGARKAKSTANEVDSGASGRLFAPDK